MSTRQSIDVLVGLVAEYTVTRFLPKSDTTLIASAIMSLNAIVAIVELRQYAHEKVG